MASKDSMRGLNIAARIWLGVGIFASGFVAYTALAQWQGRDTEQRLRVTCTALFPAALKSQAAEMVFLKTVQEFSDAVLLGEPLSVENAESDGRKVVASLTAMALMADLPSSLATEAADIGSDVEGLLADAKPTYRAAATDPSHLAPDTLRLTRELPRRMDTLKVALKQLNERVSSSLLENLEDLRGRSRAERKLGLELFLVTLTISTLLVKFTIRRGILAPLMLAEAKLAHERELLRSLMDNLPDMIYFKDLESRFTRINKAECRLLGIDDEAEAYARRDFDFFDDEHAKQAYEDEREIVRTGRPMVARLERVSGAGPDGRWMSSTKVPIRNGSGVITGMVGVSRDVTEWKRATEDLEKSEESFRLLFAAIPHAVWVYDPATLEFLTVNESAIRDYGYSVEEFHQLRFPAIHPNGEGDRLMRALAPFDPARPPCGTWKHQTKSGGVLEVDITARVIEFRGRQAVLNVVQDVSERKHLESELRQAQKLEAVAHLAAGIAHEINTPIQYVGDNIRFLQDAFAAQESAWTKYGELLVAAEKEGAWSKELRQFQQVVEEADLQYLREEAPKAICQSLDGVERVATIVRAMKEFAHPGQKDKAAADINQALASALVVARNEIKYVADIETEFGELPLVVCHIAELNQVCLNLLVNAADAIREVMKETNKKGLIRVRTCRTGSHVVVEISDTGSGIPDAIRGQVFNPFFTTKEVGHGSGQGLAIARSTVVDKHGGAIKFEPNGLQGTTFVIALPIEPAPTACNPEEAHAGAAC